METERGLKKRSYRWIRKKSEDLVKAGFCPAPACPSRLSPGNVILTDEVLV